MQMIQMISIFDSTTSYNFTYFVKIYLALRHPLHKSQDLVHFKWMIKKCNFKRNDVWKDKLICGFEHLYKLPLDFVSTIFEFMLLLRKILKTQHVYNLICIEVKNYETIMQVHFQRDV